MIWLIGAGPMAQDYVKVLKSLEQETIVIGRSAKSAEEFTKKTGVEVVTGGLEAFLQQQPELPDSVIVSVGVEQLAGATINLLNYGVKKILLEKPGGSTSQEIRSVSDQAKEKDAKVYVAYNRRHYASVLAAKKLIEEDGGVTSFNFEITEWSHIIEKHDKSQTTMNTWFLGNTSHVVDTAFFLCGKPKELSCFNTGTLKWHPSASNFAGAGTTDSGALFSYHGNWEAPGRWTLDIMTAKRRYIFRPFEQLQSQEIGTIAVNPVEVDYSLEQEFKPGLYLQCKNFLDGIDTHMCTIEDQVEFAKTYEAMAGYA